MDGEWIPKRGILVWQPYPPRTTRLKAAPPPFNTGLLACRCGATVVETCKTSGGNPTAPHAYRIVSRRCLCGAILGHKRWYCDTCRDRARKDTYRRREIRKRTAERRAA